MILFLSGLAIGAAFGFFTGFAMTSPFDGGGIVKRRTRRPGGSKPEKPDSLPEVSGTPEPPRPPSDIIEAEGEGVYRDESEDERERPDPPPNREVRQDQGADQYRDVEP